MRLRTVVVGLVVAVVGVFTALPGRPADAAIGHLTITTSVSNTQAGSTFSVTVEARDSLDNVETGFAGDIDLDAAATNGSNFAGGTQTVSATAGVANFTVALNDAADGYTITASADDHQSGTSNSFAVTASSLVVDDVSDVVAGQSFSVTVHGHDANDELAENFDSNINLDASATGGSNFTFGTQSQSASGGSATFTGLSLKNAADGYTVTAASGVLTSGTSNSFDVAAASIAIASALTNVRAGATFSLSVVARDADLNTAENFAETVTLSASAPGGLGSDFDSTPSQAASSGTAAFTSLALDDAADGYTITASATSSGALLTDTSSSFNVTAASAGLVVSTLADVRSGDSFGVTVEAHDADGNVAENFAATVNLDASATGGSNFVGGTASTSASAGVATFTGLVLNNAADGYALTASSSGFTSGTSGSFAVTARSLVITTTLANTQAGSPFSLSVDARDAAGNTAENFVGTVSLSASATGGSDFATTPSQTASGGSAGFTGLTLDDPATGYTVTASSGGLVSGTSNSFDVSEASQGLELSSSTYAGTEGSGIVVTVNRTGASTGTVTVDLDTTQGSALDPADFAGAHQTLSFGPGDTTKTVTITTVQDPIDEAPETLSVALSGATGGASLGTPASATVTIDDDDLNPVASVGDASRKEGTGSTLNMAFTITLSNPASTSRNIRYSTAPGSAVAPEDFTARSGNIVFAAGQTSRRIMIAIQGDSIDEVNETFTMNLNAASSSAGVGDGQGIGTIVDDDAAPSIRIRDAAVAEGDSGTRNMPFVITLSRASGKTVTVRFSTANGAATAPSDFTARSNVLVTFLPGQTTRTVNVSVKGDLAKEPSETMAATIFDVTNASIADSVATGVIRNDD